MPVCLFLCISAVYYWLLALFLHLLYFFLMIFTLCRYILSLCKTDVCDSQNDSISKQRKTFWTSKMDSLRNQMLFWDFWVIIMTSRLQLLGIFCLSVRLTENLAHRLLKTFFVWTESSFYRYFSGGVKEQKEIFYRWLYKVLSFQMAATLLLHQECVCRVLWVVTLCSIFIVPSCLALLLSSSGCF